MSSQHWQYFRQKKKNIQSERNRQRETGDAIKRQDKNLITCSFVVSVRAHFVFDIRLWAAPVYEKIFIAHACMGRNFTRAIGHFYKKQLN